MKEYTYNTTLGEAKSRLGEPCASRTFTSSTNRHGSKSPNGTQKTVTTWACGCEYHEKYHGMGIMFACGKHAR